MVQSCETFLVLEDRKQVSFPETPVVVHEGHELGLARSVSHRDFAPDYFFNHGRRTAEEENSSGQKKESGLSRYCAAYQSTNRGYNACEDRKNRSYKPNRQSCKTSQDSACEPSN